MQKRWTKCFAGLKKNSNVRMQRFRSCAILLDLSNVLSVAHVKKWFQDGQGPLATKSVSVVISASSSCFLIFYETAVLMPESS